MAQSNLYYALSAVLFFGFYVSSGDAIRCWECTSDRDVSCLDPFNYGQASVVDCDQKTGGYGGSYNSQTYSVCRKVVTRRNGERIVERQCAVQRHGEAVGPCDLSSSTYNQIEHCSLCYTDRCNSAFNIPAPAIYTCLFMTLVCWLATKHF